MADIQSWWAGGDQVQLALSGVDRSVFVRRLGSGSTLTLLHGFPSSSYDWAKVAGSLAADHALFVPDLLGFGASDKPPDHTYSIHEQTDLVEAVWAHFDIESTAIIAHDYSVSVTQELLARHAEGLLNVEVRSAYFLNGGIYPDLHRPQPVQVALRDPDQGAAISAQMSAELLAAALVPTFAPDYDGAADSADIWQSLERDDGYKNAHLLIRYIDDRFDHAERWTAALEATDIPLGFVWGMLDPISGAHMADRIRERLPRAPFVALDDVGHWPPIEAPDRVAVALANI